MIGTKFMQTFFWLQIIIILVELHKSKWLKKTRIITAKHCFGEFPETYHWLYNPIAEVGVLRLGLILLSGEGFTAPHLLKYKQMRSSLIES